MNKNVNPFLSLFESAPRGNITKEKDLSSYFVAVPGWHHTARGGAGRRGAGHAHANEGANRASALREGITAEPARSAHTTRIQIREIERSAGATGPGRGGAG